MRKGFGVILCAVMVLLAALACADPVVVNDSSFPDESFRSFVSENFDPDGDGMFDPSPEETKRLDPSDQGIVSLEGIGLFPDTEMLWCDNNQLTALDISKNVKLKEVFCFRNNLTEWDVNNSSVTKVYCEQNQLIRLDVSSCPGLAYLRCDKNLLPVLDISHNGALKELSCSDNQLTELDTRFNPLLEDLIIFNNSLMHLDISRNAALRQISCSANSLSELDVSQNAQLYCILCNNNQLTELDVSRNAALSRLWCGNNPLKTLDVSHNVELTELACDNNQLTKLDLSSNPKLAYLRCDHNQITELDLRNCPILVDLVRTAEPVMRSDYLVYAPAEYDGRELRVDPDVKLILEVTDGPLTVEAEPVPEDNGSIPDMAVDVPLDVEFEPVPDETGESGTWIEPWAEETIVEPITVEEQTWIEPWANETTNEPGTEEETVVSTNQENWQQAYYDFIINKGYLSSGQEFPCTIDPAFALYDLDGDGAPELLAFNGGGSHADGHTYAYFARNDAVVFAGGIGGDIWSDGLYYYENSPYSGLFFAGGGMGINHIDYRYLKDGQIVVENVRKYGTDFIDGKDVEFDTKLTSDNTLYQLVCSGEAAKYIWFTNESELEWESFIAPWSSEWMPPAQQDTEPEQEQGSVENDEQPDIISVYNDDEAAPAGDNSVDPVIAEGKVGPENPRVEMGNIALVTDGAASVDDDGTIVLTREETWKYGGIWLEHPQQYDDFSLELDFYTGNNRNGADGICIIFYADRARAGENGGAIGFDGCGGYGVEIDTYYNSGNFDPMNNHVALVYDHISNHLISADASGFTEDGLFHHMKLEVINGTARVFVDGTILLEKDGIASTGFYDIGITAATGLYCNLHMIRNISLEYPVPSADVKFNEPIRKDNDLIISWKCEPETDHYFVAARYLDEEDQFIHIEYYDKKEYCIQAPDFTRPFQIWVGAFNWNNALAGQDQMIFRNRYVYNLTSLTTQRERMEMLMKAFSEDTFNEKSIPEEWKSNTTYWNNWVFFSDWDRYFRQGHYDYDASKGYQIIRTMYDKNSKIIRQNKENDFSGTSLVTEATNKDQAKNENGYIFPDGFAYEVINLTWKDRKGNTRSHTIVTELRSITFNMNGKVTTFNTTVSNTRCPTDHKAEKPDETHGSLERDTLYLNQCTCGCYDKSGQCPGFGRMIFAMVNGLDIKEATNVKSLDPSQQVYQYGDYIRCAGHSYIILEGEAEVSNQSVKGNGIIVFDANRESNCEINYTLSNRRILDGSFIENWRRYIPPAQ